MARSHEEIEQMMAEKEKEAREKVEKGEDKPHLQLLSDLKDILGNAQNLQYHDFLNEEYAAPKIKLVEHLETIALRAKQGVYDN